MSALEFGRAEGERRKEAAINTVAVHREYWIRQIQRRFLRLLAGGESTTDPIADDVPVDIRKSCMGAAVNQLSRAGLIAFVRFVVSSRPDRHAGPARVWRLASPERATAWLLAYPELPEPDAPAGTWSMPNETPADDRAPADATQRFLF